MIVPIDALVGLFQLPPLLSFHCALAEAHRIDRNQRDIHTFVRIILVFILFLDLLLMGYARRLAGPHKLESVFRSSLYYNTPADFHRGEPALKDEDVVKCAGLVTLEVTPDAIFNTECMVVV